VDRIGCIRLPVKRLHVELTNVCNFSCEFCPDSKMKRPRGLMRKDTAMAILDEAGGEGLAETAHFHVMGEPTLHPDLADIVAHARRVGLGTCLTTNGSRLDDELLTRLTEAGLDRLIISLQTPDEETFRLRGAQDLCFDDYAVRVLGIARRFLGADWRTSLTVSFLSSPLRRLIIPIYPEVSIADTSADLKRHMARWADLIIKGTAVEKRRPEIVKQIDKTRSWLENTIRLSDRLSFQTRIMGDWSVHFDRRNVDAVFSYCPALRENFGVLWNGDYTFCCADFDAGTTTANFGGSSLREYLGSEEVQRVARGFSRFRVLHPYCRQCLGDRNLLNAFVKQIGSIFYFKCFRKLQ
jgi:hypothetical protein